MRKKEELRLKRHKRIRMKMLGTADKPRLVVHRSLKNISAQVLDDTRSEERRVGKECRL